MVRGHRSEDEEDLLSTGSSGSSSDSDYSNAAEKRRSKTPAVPPASDNQTALLLVIGFLVLAALLFAGFKAYESMSVTSDGNAMATVTTTPAVSASAASSSSTGGSTGVKGVGGSTGATPTPKPSSSADAVKGEGSSGKSSSSSSSSKAAGAGGDGSPGGANTKDGHTSVKDEDATSVKETVAATPTPAPSTNSPSTGKKGVGYNNADYTKDLKISWGYNWASQSDPLASGTYIPMLWGQKSVEGWSTNAQKAIDAGADYILGFNEPDHPEQAKMTPQEAVDLWNAQIASFGSKAKLVSPGVTNGVGTDDAPMGVPWLQQFLKLCSGCQIDAVALHWYDKATNVEYFKKHFTEAHATLNKPIWITEFMGLGTPDEQATFLKDVVPWLEEQDFIERYAAFGDFADNPVANFVDSSGKLLPLGQVYADLP